MKKSFAIFDVDYTIINCDSMIYMFLFGIKKKPWLAIYTPIIVIKLVLLIIGIIDTKNVKESLYMPIKYLNNDDLNEFYQKVLFKRLYNESLGRLKYYKDNGYHVMLVSASPEIYLKYFKNTGYVDAVLGTKLIEVNGKTINKIDGHNCKSEYKVNRIVDYLIESELEIDFDNSCAYSDSRDDIPMLSLVKNKYKVNKKDGSVGEFAW